MALHAAPGQARGGLARGPMTTTKKTGLILTGGGARAAYQVGVLKAVAELLGQPRESPFPILCGTSAGAINAAALAIHADDFAESGPAPRRRLGRLPLRPRVPQRLAGHHAHRPRAGSAS